MNTSSLGSVQEELFLDEFLLKEHHNKLLFSCMLSFRLQIGLKIPGYAGTAVS